MRYSDYTIEQLREEVSILRERADKAEQLGEISEVAINERKIQIVMSYMLNPEDFTPRATYKLSMDPGHTFKINYINGVMAWGHQVNLLGEVYEKEDAIPLSLLGEKVSEK